jgi:uncharacterized protein (UPF0212 family)
MGSLDKWEVEPLLILLSIHVSLVSSSEKASKGAHHEVGQCMKRVHTANGGGHIR